MIKEKIHKEEVDVISNENHNKYYYEQVLKIIDEWPDWKKEIHQKLIRLTT